MPAITLYSKPHCPLCDQTRFYLRRLGDTDPRFTGWTLNEVSILDDPDLFAAYRYLIPVVVVDEGPALTAPAALDETMLAEHLAATIVPGAVENAPVAAHQEAGGPQAAVGGGAARGVPVPSDGFFDRLGLGITDHWLAGVNTLVGTFAILPWLAPIFARLGWWGLADPIYTIYMLFCHQLPERAAFVLGYQVAYCYRNSAIYTTIFLTGLLYAVARGNVGGWLARFRRPISVPLFVVMLLPVAVDGLSHMFGLREDNAWFTGLTGGRLADFATGDSLGTLNWWLRVITGALFGYAIVRLVYPWVHIALEQSRQMVWPAPLPPARMVTADGGPAPAL